MLFASSEAKKSTGRAISSGVANFPRAMRAVSSAMTSGESKESYAYQPSPEQQSSRGYRGKLFRQISRHTDESRLRRIIIDRFGRGGVNAICGRNIENQQSFPTSFLINRDDRFGARNKTTNPDPRRAYPANLLTVFSENGLSTTIPALFTRISTAAELFPSTAATIFPNLFFR